MKIRGFTLLEMLLVIVIIAAIMSMFVGYTLRKSQETMIDKSVLTMQQILNAGLAFYVDNGQWPGYTDGNGSVLMGGDNLDLMVQGYLPDQTIRSFWGDSSDDSTQKWGIIFFSERGPDPQNPLNKNFTVCMPISAGPNAVGIAETIAGRLPLGRTTQANYATCGDAMEIIPCDGTTTCNVVTTVGVPGQNLNNARSTNFAGIYKNGACVPTPECPKGMEPQIIVSPVSVSGLYYGMNGPSSTSGDVFPINSFTAYATGPAVWNKAQGSRVPNCTSTGPDPNCEKEPGVPLPDGNIKYWRVCLEIVTEQGKLTDRNTSSAVNWQKESGTVMVVTRCVPPNEPKGSNENVFQPY